MNNKLALMCGTDLLFEEGRLTIHQPTISEISFIGETAFFSGCNLLNFSKNMLDEKDKEGLDALTNFEVLMSIMKDNSLKDSIQLVSVNMVLALLFPTYEIKFEKDFISFFKFNKESNTVENGFINKDNFEKFKEKIKLMLCLGDMLSSEDDYNPAGELARQIAEKLKERHRKLAEMRRGDANDKEVSILGRYISILAVAEQKDINKLKYYTVFQLNDEFQRWQLKSYNDKYFSAKVAGASGMDEPEDWTKDLYEKQNPFK